VKRIKYAIENSFFEREMPTLMYLLPIRISENSTVMVYDDV